MQNRRDRDLSRAAARRGCPTMEAIMKLQSLLPIGRDRSIARRDANPFATLQREVDRLFEDFGRGLFAMPTFGTMATDKQDLWPSMDLTETDKQIELTAELP